MTKYLRISLLAVLVFILAFGLIAAAGSAATIVAADLKPNVGWHTSTSLQAFLPGPDAQPNVGWNGKSSAWVVPGPDAQPNVGWNGKSSAWVLPGIMPCIGWNT